MGKCEVEKMINYTLSPEMIVMVSGSGIGTQVKDYDDGMWYKQNKAGYEGIAECLSSKVLACSNIRDFVMYHTCKINGKDGCVSKNFLRPTESYISIQRLYDIYYEGKLDKKGFPVLSWRVIFP